MPWDELVPRDFPAFDKNLDGVSRQTMEDHHQALRGLHERAGVS